MVIRFKKGKNRSKHKPDTLTCIRDDGSVTWTHLHRGFVQHDFAHYVVEKTLGFENAFFGLVAKGYNIPDFSEPKAERSFEIPEEAIDTEPIVALLQADLREDLGYSGDSDGIFQDHRSVPASRHHSGTVEGDAAGIEDIVGTMVRSTAG